MADSVEKVSFPTNDDEVRFTKVGEGVIVEMDQSSIDRHKPNFVNLNENEFVVAEIENGSQLRFGDVLLSINNEKLNPKREDETSLGIKIKDKLARGFVSMEIQRTTVPRSKIPPVELVRKREWEIKQDVKIEPKDFETEIMRDWLGMTVSKPKDNIPGVIVSSVINSPSTVGYGALRAGDIIISMTYDSKTYPLFEKMSYTEMNTDFVEFEYVKETEFKSKIFKDQAKTLHNWTISKTKTKEQMLKSGLHLLENDNVAQLLANFMGTGEPLQISLRDLKRKYNVSTILKKTYLMYQGKDKNVTSGFFKVIRLPRDVSSRLKESSEMDIKTKMVLNFKDNLLKWANKTSGSISFNIYRAPPPWEVPESFEPITMEEHTFYRFSSIKDTWFDQKYGKQLPANFFHVPESIITERNYSIKLIKRTRQLEKNIIIPFHPYCDFIEVAFTNFYPDYFVLDGALKQRSVKDGKFHASLYRPNKSFIETFSMDTMGEYIMEMNVLEASENKKLDAIVGEKVGDKLYRVSTNIGLLENITIDAINVGDVVSLSLDEMKSSKNDNEGLSNKMFVYSIAEELDADGNPKYNKPEKSAQIHEIIVKKVGRSATAPIVIKSKMYGELEKYLSDNFKEPIPVRGKTDILQQSITVDESYKTKTLEEMQNVFWKAITKPPDGFLELGVIRTNRKEVLEKDKNYFLSVFRQGKLDYDIANKYKQDADDNNGTVFLLSDELETFIKKDQKEWWKESYTRFLTIMEPGDNTKTPMVYLIPVQKQDLTPNLITKNLLFEFEHIDGSIRLASFVSYEDTFKMEEKAKDDLVENDGMSKEMQKGAIESTTKVKLMDNFTCIKIKPFGVVVLGAMGYDRTIFDVPWPDKNSDQYKSGFRLPGMYAHHSIENIDKRYANKEGWGELKDINGVKKDTKSGILNSVTAAAKDAASATIDTATGSLAQLLYNDIFPETTYKVLLRYIGTDGSLREVNLGKSAYGSCIWAHKVSESKWRLYYARGNAHLQKRMFDGGMKKASYVAAVTAKNAAKMYISPSAVSEWINKLQGIKNEDYDDFDPQTNFEAFKNRDIMAVKVSSYYKKLKSVWNKIANPKNGEPAEKIKVQNFVVDSGLVCPVYSENTIEVFKRNRSGKDNEPKIKESNIDTRSYVERQYSEASTSKSIYVPHIDYTPSKFFKNNGTPDKYNPFRPECAPAARETSACCYWINMSSRLLPPGYSHVINGVLDDKDAHYKWLNRKTLPDTNLPSSIALQYDQPNPYETDFATTTKPTETAHITIDQVLGELPDGRGVGKYEAAWNDAPPPSGNLGDTNAFNWPVPGILEKDSNGNVLRAVFECLGSEQYSKECYFELDTVNVLMCDARQLYSTKKNELLYSQIYNKRFNENDTKHSDKYFANVNNTDRARIVKRDRVFKNINIETRSETRPKPRTFKESTNKYYYPKNDFKAILNDNNNTTTKMIFEDDVEINKYLGL